MELLAYEVEHLKTLRALAPECMVLLKKNGDFPLEEPCKLALYGAGARDTVKGGTGSGDVNVRDYVTIEQGLLHAGFSVTTTVWMDAYAAASAEGKKRFLDGIIAEAKEKGVSPVMLGMGRVQGEPRCDYPMDGEGEVCVYVLRRNSGEGADRKDIPGDLRLTEDEVRDILACQQKYEKFLLVLNVGGPVELAPVADKVENILLLSQLGSVTGDAFADVLLGKAYPSGKLTTTWATAAAYEAAAKHFGENDDTRYTEGIFVGYRYYEAAGITPTFPFGFGLGYTDFETRMTELTEADGVITVKAKMRNIGRFAGKETVQLFYSAPQGMLVKPLRELGAYAKTKELQPGESETLTLQLPIENMASWDEIQDRWLLEKGEYVLSLSHEPVGMVILDDDVALQAGCHAGGDPDFVDWKPNVERTLPEGVPTLTVSAAKLQNAEHFGRYKIAAETLPLPDVSAYSDDDLALLCTGKHTGATGIMAVLGSSASRVAGGAGETADLAEEKGFGKIVMADGPAGLRLAREYMETEDGQESISMGALGWIADLLQEPIKSLIEAKVAQNREKAEKLGVRYHYASAIPIGTALAQAWNPAVPEACGDLVGEEMELFGVNVWLAPAMNIHRSPLCGRNFEYYSEDPIVSGKTAAGVVRGVQKHEKCAVTIKHFCCNNQETNRFGSNSIVSERALREIYLKGFELCVKESAPKCVMSSYNLLNGVHTANHRDLLTDVLRNEWGFAGIVMTDWGTTGDEFNHGKHGCSSASGCIAAGNDLIMSGTVRDVQGILASRADGSLSRAELETCAARILAMSKRVSQ